MAFVAQIVDDRRHIFGDVDGLRVAGGDDADEAVPGADFEHLRAALQPPPVVVEVARVRKSKS